MDEPRVYERGRFLSGGEEGPHTSSQGYGIPSPLGSHLPWPIIPLERITCGVMCLPSQSPLRRLIHLACRHLNGDVIEPAPTHPWGPTLLIRSQIHVPRPQPGWPCLHHRNWLQRWTSISFFPLDSRLTLYQDPAVLICIPQGEKRKLVGMHTLKKKETLK